jgi:hypothetical protein
MNGYLRWNTINVNDVSNYWCSLSMNSEFLSATKILYGVRVMVFKATSNNISVISWRSVLLLEEPGVPCENNRPVANHWQILSHNVVSSHTRNEADSNSVLLVIGRNWLIASSQPRRSAVNLICMCLFINLIKQHNLLINWLIGV